MSINYVPLVHQVSKSSSLGSLAIALVLVVGCGRETRPPEVGASDGGTVASSGAAKQRAVGGASIGSQPNSMSSRQVERVASDITTNTTWVRNRVYVVEKTPQIRATLTLEPGVVVKFGPAQGLGVADGKLIANGTSSNPCIFTSIKDDTAGGDTNADGNASAPSRDDWGGVHVVSKSGSLFNDCRFLYSGGPALELSIGGVATVTNCTFAHNKGASWVFSSRAALSASEAGKGTVIVGNRFFDNDAPLSINENISIDNSNVFRESDVTTANGNTYNGILCGHDFFADVMTGDTVWSNTQVPYLLTRSIDIPAGASLTLGKHVMLKAYQAKITIHGSLLQDVSNTFTSLNDPTVGGNSSGTNDVPTKGDWEGIEVCKGNCQWAKWENVRYAAHP